MPMTSFRVLALTLLVACCALAQTIDPFPAADCDTANPCA